MSDQSIFYPMIIEHIQELSPSEINDNTDINSILIEKIKDDIGDKCQKNGFIKKDSIKILDRSIGKIISSHFNGDIIFNLKLETMVCNPLEGSIINCEVIGINKVGIMCKKTPILIVLSKIYHEDKLDIFQSIKVGDRIDVEVICSRYEFNDNEINVIGKLLYI